MSNETVDAVGILKLDKAAIIEIIEHYLVQVEGYTIVSGESKVWSNVTSDKDVFFDNTEVFMSLKLKVLGVTNAS